MLLTRHHIMPVGTLFFSLTHVTYVTLHHIVVIRYNTSVTYRTLSGTAPVLLTGHYAMPVVTWGSTASATDLRERFLLSAVFYLAPLPTFFKASLGLAVQRQS